MRRQIRRWAPLGLAILTGCASPRTEDPPRDPALAEAMQAAAKAFREGQPDRAERFYRVALQRARAADDPVAVRDAATSLALVLAAYGHGETALVLIGEARQAAREAGGPVGALDVAEARIAWSAGDAERAEASARRAVETGRRDEGRAARVILAELAFAAADRAGLEEQADVLVRENLRGALAAERLRILGYRQQMDRRPETALDYFVREADAWHRLDRYEDQARAQRRAAAMAEQAGRLDEALDRTYRSIRSFHALGRREEAAALIPEVGRLVGVAGWPEVPGHWQRLFDEVRARPEFHENALSEPTME